MTATTRAGSATIERLRDALLGNALPGELDGFTHDEQVEAASFIADVAAQRRRGELALRLESTGGEAGRRRMRMAIINDDMPFLVNSVANAIAARQLTIHRLLHPVVCVDRDADGALQDIAAKCVDDERRESMMYIEIDRADARGRRELIDEIRAVLTDVRAAVRDWPAMQRQMRDDAKRIADPEGGALLDWFADGAMTLLGYQVERPGEEWSHGLGLFSIPGAPTDKGGAVGAMRIFRAWRGDSADRQGRAQVERPPPRAARPGRRAAARRRHDHRHRSPCRAVDQPGADPADRGSAGAPPPAERPRQGVRLRPARP